MRLVVKSMWVVALGFLSNVGCTQVSTPPETAQIQIAVSEFVEGTVLEGATICQTGTTNCWTTNARGFAMLELPPNQKLSYTVEKKGYGSLLYPFMAEASEISSQSRMYTDEWLTDALTNLESHYPFRGTGAILVFIVPSPFAGATFDLLNATGKRYYDDENDLPNDDLEATTSASRGGFIEVGPGAFQIEIGGTAERCTPRAGRAWPGDAENRFEVPVQEGFQTRVVVDCQVSP